MILIVLRKMDLSRRKFDPGWPKSWLASVLQSSVDHLDGLKEALAKIGDLSLDSIDGKISEGPASWSMEDGKILPEPGQEGAEWYSETAIK